MPKNIYVVFSIICLQTDIFFVIFICFKYKTYIVSSVSVRYCKPISNICVQLFWSFNVKLGNWKWFIQDDDSCNKDDDEDDGDEDD